MTKKIIKHIDPDLEIDSDVVIIASSAKALEGKRGSIIDQFADVVRFNRSPTEGYEEFVGSKTTIRIANQHVFGNVIHEGWDIGDKRHDTFIRDQRNQDIVHIGPGLEFWNQRSDHVHESCNAFLGNFEFISSELSPILGHNPSVGFAFLWLCLISGVRPTILGYGLDEESYGHYYDENAVSSHSFAVERNIIKEWINSNQIKML